MECKKIATIYKIIRILGSFMYRGILENVMPQYEDEGNDAGFNRTKFVNASSMYVIKDYKYRIQVLEWPAQYLEHIKNLFSGY